MSPREQKVLLINSVNIYEISRSLNIKSDGASRLPVQEFLFVIYSTVTIDAMTVVLTQQGLKY